MNLPFTTDQFLYTFDAYNRAVWPGQIVAYVCGAMAVALALTRLRWSGRVISTILGVMWIWVGGAYHLMFFRAVNPAATLFGALFITQGLMFILFGVVKHDLRFRAENSVAGWTGLAMVLYSMVAYPLLGQQLGHVYPEQATFGVTPCPTTIFTLGLILWSLPTVPRILLPILWIWSAIAGTAAVSLGMKEDYALPISAAVVLLLFVEQRIEERRHHLPTVPT